MLISSSPFQKEEKEYTWVKYLINIVLSRFKICWNLRAFPAKSAFENFGVHKKCYFPSLIEGGQGWLRVIMGDWGWSRVIKGYLIEGN